jgi:hypothetical protein
VAEMPCWTQAHLTFHGDCYRCTARVFAELMNLTSGRNLLWFSPEIITEPVSLFNVLKFMPHHSESFSVDNLWDR